MKNLSFTMLAFAGTLAAGTLFADPEIFKDIELLNLKKTEGKGGALEKNNDLNFESENEAGNRIKYNAVELTGGYARGGAIFDSDKIITLKGLYANIFEGNYVKTSSSSYGGAIFNSPLSGSQAEGKGFFLTGTSTQFIGNYAHSTGSGSWVWGGAIYGNVYIQSGTNLFEGNYVLSEKSRAYGGVVYGNIFEITDGTNTFRLNKAQSNSAYDFAGGAVASTQYFRIKGGNNLFEGNTSLAKTVQGGAIEVNNTGAIISGGVSRFKDNSATTQESEGSAQGGAIYFYSGATFSGTSQVFFTGNSVSAYREVAGGAIYSNEGNLTLGGAKTLFENNKAIIYENSTVSRSATAGAIYSGGILTLAGGENTFRGNLAKSSSSASAGAIYAYKLNITDGENLFENNSVQAKAGASGGAIYASTLTISGGKTTFKNNFVQADPTQSSYTVQGGAIRANTINFSGNTTEVTFSGNTAGGNPNDIYTGALNISGTGTYTFGGGVEAWQHISIKEGAKVQFGTNARIFCNSATNTSSVINAGTNVSFAAGTQTYFYLFTLAYNAILKIYGENAKFEVGYKFQFGEGAALDIRGAGTVIDIKNYIEFYGTGNSLTIAEGAQLRMTTINHSALSQAGLNLELGDAYLKTDGGNAFPMIVGAKGTLDPGTITIKDINLSQSVASTALQFYIFDADASVTATQDSFVLSENLRSSWAIDGFEHGVLTLSMIPEPSLFGILAGVSALILACSRRRRQR